MVRVYYYRVSRGLRKYFYTNGEKHVRSYKSNLPEGEKWYPHSRVGKICSRRWEKFYANKSNPSRYAYGPVVTVRAPGK